VEQVAFEHDLLVPSAGPGGLTLNDKIPPRALYGLGSHFRESDPGTEGGASYDDGDGDDDDDDLRSPKASIPVMCAFSLTGRSDQSVVARAVFANLEYPGMQTSKHPSSLLFDRSKCVWRVWSARVVAR
jgi:hypothetical protein